MDKNNINENSLFDISNFISNESQRNIDNNQTVRRNFQTNSTKRSKLFSDYSKYSNITDENGYKEEDIIENEMGDVSIRIIQTNKCKKYSDYFNVSDANQFNNNVVNFGNFIKVL